MVDIMSLLPSRLPALSGSPGLVFLPGGLPVSEFGTDIICRTPFPMPPPLSTWSLSWSPQLLWEPVSSSSLSCPASLRDPSLVLQAAPTQSVHGHLVERNVMALKRNTHGTGFFLPKWAHAFLGGTGCLPPLTFDAPTSPYVLTRLQIRSWCHRALGFAPRHSSFHDTLG